MKTINQLQNEYGTVCLHICTRDRPTELALLLQSLRTQTYQDFDIIISDDMSGTPTIQNHFMGCILSKMKEEGHKILYNYNTIGLGVSKNRQKCVEIAMAQTKKYKLMGRLDDDVIVESDYIERLVKVIDSGYDLASGVTPPIMQSVLKRETKFIEPIVDECYINSKGELIMNMDDCGALYLESKILPCDHFRSCAIYKRELHEKGVDYKNTLTKHGFREEQIFSFKAILEGFTIGVDTGAIAWHLLTPSGGERFKESNELVMMNEMEMRKWIKLKYEEHGDFIQTYHEKLKIGKRELDLKKFYKESNLGTRGEL